MNANEVSCPDCGGTGVIVVTELVGYVERWMAMDAGDMDLQGQPVYGEVPYQCGRCQGGGVIVHRRPWVRVRKPSPTDSIETGGEA